MNILLSGSSGLVGSALVPLLKTQNHSVRTLARRPGGSSVDISWNPPHSGPNPGQLEGIEAVIHLAGESIASGRWTESKKRAIRESRISGTRLLSEALAAMKSPPKVFISASAIGFYGDRGNEVVREESAAGTGFLADVCQAWEAATAPASEKGIRVIHLRFGIILSPRGGALAKMLFPFKMGVGGVIGSGNQYMSWVALDDVLGIITHTLSDESLRGAVNAVAPQSVTNAGFTKALGRVLGRPTIFPLPAFAARLAFGEMADALLLAGARVEPAVLTRAHYPFQYPELEGALVHLLTN